MAFDVLQRWHENSHVNTSGYNIHPAQLTPVPKTGAWQYINEALSNILPQLDPVQIARRRMTLQQIQDYQAQQPLRTAKLQAETQLLPSQIELQKQTTNTQLARNKMLLQAYKSGGVNPITGKPWTDSEKNRIFSELSFDIYNDIANHSNPPSEGIPPMIQRPAEIPSVEMPPNE